jgi:hypothetical protein
MWLRSLPEIATRDQEQGPTRPAHAYADDGLLELLERPCYSHQLR